MTYGYTIANAASNVTFNNAIRFIIEKLHYTVAGKLLEDVDGSLFQMFSKDGVLLRLESDVQIDYVAILSSVPLPISCLHEWTIEKELKAAS